MLSGKLGKMGKEPMATMAAARIILVIASIIALGWIAYGITTDTVFGRYYFVEGLVAGALLFLNMIYLNLSHVSERKTRLRRLVDLWFDAKERELSSRGKPPPQSN